MLQTTKGFIKIGTIAVSVLLLTMVAMPAFARPAQVAYGARWLGICGPQSVLSDAAQVLGVSVDELRQARASGKTMEQIAEEKGMSVETLINRIIEIRKGKIEALVTNGTLTEEQAQNMLTNLENNVKLAINGMYSGYCSDQYAGCGRGRFQSGRACGAWFQSNNGATLPK